MRRRRRRSRRPGGVACHTRRCLRRRPWNGRAIVSALGAIDVPVYLRSTAKPFIAAAAVREGVVERFGLEPHEIALMAASHNGEPFHIAAVRSMLRKIGLPETALACGAHPPYEPASAEAFVREGIAFSPIHNNCSGKHAGILALSTLLGAGVATIASRTIPRNNGSSSCARARAGSPSRSFRSESTAAEFPSSRRRCATQRKRSPVSPRLDGSTTRDAAALRHRARSNDAYPQYVAGTGEFDTALMRAGAGRIAAKSGAEGVHGIAIVKEPAWPSKSSTAPRER